MTPQIRYVILLYTTLLCNVPRSAIAMAVFQSGPKQSNTYAGGIVFDQATNNILVSGSAFETHSATAPNPEPSCFLGVVSLPSFEWLQRASFGSPDISESCSALALGPSSVVVTGSTQNGGLYTNLGSKEAQQYGFVMNVEHKQNAVGEALGGVSLQMSTVQSPISVVSHGTSIFVSSIHSLDSAVVSDGSVSDSSGSTAYGSMIHKFTIDGGSLKHDWMQQITDSSAVSTYVGEMLIKRNSLLVVGSTTGGTSWEDGYIAAFDLDSGDAAGSQQYINHVWGQMLTGICDGDDDGDYFFIVGTGQADEELMPVLTKMKFDTFTQVWQKKLRPISPTEGGKATAHGLSCKVSGDVVYIAGTVKADAYFEGTDSSGSEDIFLAQYGSGDGDLNWLRQLGSPGRDTLAHGGGLTLDALGNAVLYGSTDGSFFREKNDSHSDLFLVSVDKVDGTVGKITNMKKSESEGGEDDRGSDVANEISSGKKDSPKVMAEEDTSKVQKEEPVAMKPQTKAVPKAPKDESGIQEGNQSGLGGFWAALYIPALFVVIAGCFVCFRDEQRRNAEESDHRIMMSIFKYVHAFEVDDVDIKRSPTGGYHAIYLNELADGINNYDPAGKEEEENEAAPMKSASAGKTRAKAGLPSIV